MFIVYKSEHSGSALLSRCTSLRAQTNCRLLFSPTPTPHPAHFPVAWSGISPLSCFYWQYFRHQTCGIFPHHNQFISQDTDWMSYNSFNAGTKYLEPASDSIGLRAQSHKNALNSDTSCKKWVPRYPHFYLTWLQSRGFPEPLFSGSTTYSNGSQNSGKCAILTVPSLL